MAASFALFGTAPIMQQPLPARVIKGCYNNAAMPTCFLVCEGCGTRQPSVLDDAAMAQLQDGKTYQKHCLTCRTTTDWALAFMDRRSGQDRRKGGSGRRKTDPQDQ
jgi:hypothetical protein